VGDRDIENNEANNSLKRVLGLKEAVALGIGGTIGGGIFVLIGAAAGLAGPGILLAFVLAFCASSTIALPYAELACRYPQAGGGYAFASAVLGSTWGFLMGWGYWGAYLFISGYVTLGFGGYLHALTGVPRVICAAALIVVLTILNIAGVKISGRAQTLIVVLGLVGIVGFGLLGLSHAEPGNFIPMLPNGTRGVFQAALLTFLAFGGFDMVAAAGEEIEQPNRNLPLAIMITLVAVLGIYLLVAYVAVGVLPWQTLGASSAPLADSARVFLGPFGGWLISGIALLTTAATANAVLLTVSRISFAMARDSLLPRGLAVVHPVTGTPYISVFVSGGFLCLVAVAGSISLATAVGGFLYVCQFLLSLASLAILRRRKVGTPAFQMPLPSVILPLACAACLLLLASSGSVGMLGGIGWLLLGLLINRRSSLSRLVHPSQKE